MSVNTNLFIKSLVTRPDSGQSELGVTRIDNTCLKSLERLEKDYSTVKAWRDLEKEHSWYKNLNEELGTGHRQLFGRTRINLSV